MTEQNRTQELLLLGEIKGIVQGLKDGQDAMSRRVDVMQESIESMDGRLRAVEQRSAVVGAVSGGAVSVGMAFLVEGLKQWLHKG